MSILHVSNGHCATSLIEAAGLPGRTMAWCDPLYDGPVPGNVPEAELLRARAAFLAGTPEAVDDVERDLANWRRAVDDHAGYDELVLWFEHDLFDQLNLIQLLAHLGRNPNRPKPVTLICIGSHPGHPDFKGLGELRPSDIAALFPQRTPVTQEQYALASRAWAAFRSSEPTAIEALLGTDTSALPFLAPALARHLQEFPSERDGLSRTERRMLEIAVEAPVELRAAFPRMHAGERAFYVTDTMLVDRAKDLSSSLPPLITMNIAGDEQGSLPKGTIALTKTGHDVLNGRADRVKLCGIDRWFGGVHVTGHGPAWRWSEGEKRMVRS